VQKSAQPLMMTPSCEYDMEMLGVTTGIEYSLHESSCALLVILAPPPIAEETRVKLKIRQRGVKRAVNISRKEYD
jgi:hypothetical protein